jgi:L-ascorbate metabolism protein UlaG (beta-lactamase superfamily)
MQNAVDAGGHERDIPIEAPDQAGICPADGRSKNMIRVVLLAIILGGAMNSTARDGFLSDTIRTSAGDLKITFIGHGSLVFGFAGKVVHVDPYGEQANYSRQPKADIILLTHEHGDHLDADAIRAVRTTNTVVVLTQACATRVAGGTAMTNGETRTAMGIGIEAVPAYNIVNKRDSGEPFHPRGAGNGYVLTFGDCRVYVAGDTENTPEMKALKKIDVAFLPMNLPYTMTPEMVADAAKALRPGILYPYHYGSTDTSKLTALLKAVPEIEVRIRPMR